MVLFLVLVTPILIALIYKRLISGSNEDAYNQNVLDNYLQHLSEDITNAELGLLYERYIGYLYESDGYRVDYHGAIKGYDDLGRDLIVSKGNETWIIQTKCWAKYKQISEKHIFQLYGSLEYYKKQKNKKNVNAKFYTTAKYSEETKNAARLLGIALKTEKLNRTYPMIKCNISDKTKNKYYHLPFDEYYDTIKIEPHKGEFFAKTVKEATSKGFQRTKHRKAA